MAEAQCSACGPDSVSSIANCTFSSVMKPLWGVHLCWKKDPQSTSSLNFGAEDYVPHLPQACPSHQAVDVQRHLLPILPVEILLPQQTGLERKSTSSCSCRSVVRTVPMHRGDPCSGPWSWLVGAQNKTQRQS